MAPRMRLNVELTPGLDRVKGRWVRATKDFNDRNYALMGHYARKASRLTKEEAPVGETGKFKKGIFARRKRRLKTVVGFTLTVPEPLGTFIRKGTKPHRIQARNANALVFPWAAKGLTVVVHKAPSWKTHVSNSVMWSGKGYVDHPGTKANDFVKRAQRRWYPQMAKELKRTARSYTKDLADV